MEADNVDKILTGHVSSVYYMACVWLPWGVFFFLIISLGYGTSCVFEHEDHECKWVIVLYASCSDAHLCVYMPRVVWKADE